MKAHIYGNTMILLSMKLGNQNIANAVKINSYNHMKEESNLHSINANFI